jgi:predicted metal-dependent peptidase
MSSPYTSSHLATGLIKRACARLAGKYPFHARVLEKFTLVASNSLETMGVTAKNDRVTLLFNPEFTLSLKPDVLIGVLLHEVHHVVLGHLTLGPADYPDEWAFTVALEVSVNEFITEPLPSGVVLLEHFPMLPPMESSQQRYRRLERQTARMPISGPGGAVMAGAGVRKGAAGQGGVVIDDHSIWGDLSDDTKQAIADLMQQAALEAGGMPVELLRACRMAGTETLGNVSVLVGDRPGCLDWRQLLRRYTGRILQPGPTFTRPPRRFPDLVGVWPGQKRVDSRASVVAIIDTSGSITDEILEQIDGELYRLSRSHTVQVVECDCVVHRVYRYSGRLKMVQGRGGTDFHPPLAPAFLRPLHPDLIIYFSDGIGPAPGKGPKCPLIWCLTPDGEPPARWGRVIRMASEGLQ